MKKHLTIFAIILLLSATEIVLSQNTWDGSASTSWGVAANWSLGHVPLAGENVVISSVPANQPLLSGATGVCNNLTINSGATLTISATSTLNALLTASGNAIVNGSLSIGGTPLKTAKLMVVNITWVSGSSMAGFYNGSIEVSGNWEFSAGSVVSMGYSQVVFTGSTNTEIINKSSSSSFSGVTISKNSGNTVSIGSTSTAALNFEGSVTINSGSALLGPANISTIFSSGLYNTGHFSFTSGTTRFVQSSGTQVIQVNTGDVFNNLTINGGATVTINNYLQVLNDVTIQSGIFDPLGNIVVLFGDWSNTVGPGGFTEGTGRVVFSGGNYHQYSSTETFNILEVHKAIGGAFRVNGSTVTCAQYDWTAGSVDVLNNGIFTALDLADNGLFGGYYVTPGSMINLYQDGTQFVDLNGNLVFTGGGNINVFGGGSTSVWAFGDDASVTMNGGTLDFKNQGLSILAAAPYTFSSSISGGTIRTTGNVVINSASFDPTGGIFEMYGSAGRTLEVTNGWLYHLSINKGNGYSVTLAASGTVKGDFTIDNGIFIADNKIITLGGNLFIYDEGIFHIGPGSQLRMSAGVSIIVGNGGTLETYGNGADQAEVTHSAGYYYLDVQSGGTISSRYTTFQYSYRLLIGMGGIIDPANAFYHCTFANFSTSSFLSVQNTQTLSLHEVNFPSLPPVNNVSKGSNSGYLYFRDATGAYAGPAYEYDPYNRVFWTASTPGQWTGEISSDWYTAQNWDDYAVPAAATNVTIPSGTPYSPLISAGDGYCNNITIQPGAVLSVGAGGLNIAGNMTVHGQLEMTNAGGDIDIAGNIYWEAGSTANFTANGKMYVDGDWEFKNGANAQLAYGYVYFTGATTSYIRSYEANCSFRSLLNSKTGGYLYVSSSSTDSLKITGYYSNQNPTSWFYSASSYPIVLKQQLYNYGHIYCAAGTFIFDGITQNIDLNTGDYFNNIIISPSSEATLADSLRVHGNLTIDGGTLVTNNYPILIQGNWANNVGTAGFAEGTGRVTFEGSGPSDILTDETFCNLWIDKTYAGLDGVEVNDSVSVTANLNIADGTMEMNSGSRLNIGNQLTIATAAGLNANDSDVEIYSAEDWYDSNPTATTTVGFNAGTYSVVHFLGKSANVQTIQENCPFNDVVVNGAGTYARPEFYDMVCMNLNITAGRLLLGGYKITVNENITVGAGILQMTSAADSLVVGGDITWQPGSTDNITTGVIMAGSDWTFQNGTNASLGTGNTVVFNNTLASLIRCDDANAAFGNVVIGKPAGPSADAFIHNSSTDTMRVTGTMTVNAGNQFHLQGKRLTVDGNLDVQSTGEMDMIAGGYLLNNFTAFILNGKLNVNAGTALIHGTYSLPVTGELDIAGGSFTSDAPVGAKSWQHMGGIFNMTGGTFEITNNSVSILATAVTNISGGTIISGYAFSAEHAGTFHPTGGLVKCTHPLPGEASIYCSSGNYFNDLEISGSMGLNTDITIKNNLLISSGWLSSDIHDIYIEGNWTNNVGPGGFIENGKTVYFTGPNDADITTNETFHNVVVAKTNPNFTALELAGNTTMNVTNDLTLTDGSFELNGGSALTIGNHLAIANGAGLNANEAAEVTISIAGDWTNYNTSHSVNYGFEPGDHSSVKFIGTADQFLSTACLHEDFNNLVIDKSSGKFRPNDNTRSYGNILIQNGIWEDNVTGLTHQLYHDFTVAPAGGFYNSSPLNTVEFMGMENSLLTYSGTTGYFHDLVINKGAGAKVTQVGNTSCQYAGSLTINLGIYDQNGYLLHVFGDVNINDAGKLKLTAGSDLRLAGLRNLNVNSGGICEIAGTSGNQVEIRANIGTVTYNFNVNPGGTISADYCTFRNTGPNGVYVAPGSVVDPAHAFTGCTFQDGYPGGALLVLNSSQVLTVRNAIFPTNAGAGSTNVSKTLGTGHVYFVDYSGVFSGEDHDGDGYNLIDWIPTLTATATAVPGTVCAGTGSQLNVIRTGGLASFTCAWSPATGLSNPAIINPVATPLATTTYSITVTDALGTTATSSILVTVNPVLPVSVTIAASANPSPPDYFVMFTASAVNGGSSPAYQWKINGVNGVTGSSAFAYIPVNGDEVTCILTSSYACPLGNPATSNAITMIIVPASTMVTGTVPAPLHSCYDASGTITVAGDGNTFVVEAGGSATMIAGMNILYKPGTTVQTGGYMHGYITTTNAYCGNVPLTMVSSVPEVIESVEELQTLPVTANLTFSVYPNPTTGRFTLIQKCGNSDGTVILEIFSMRGERVYASGMVNEQRHVFNVSSLPAGLYFAKIVKDDYTETIKLIVNK
ncbi:MAG: T9SS type A sorting domain-containing protein [Bacteroidetes bacterium]|nr:T9SS type A sorting domain-containing protein [Bacteroidota bacterium]